MTPGGSRDDASRALRVARLDAALPQTQCTQCGYDGCRPYAEAMADGQVAPNRCPPGGEAGAATLAGLLGVAALPLDRSRGEPGPLTVAVIDESHCIGCTLCIRACPVDAIVGANKRMHTVLAEACTGCGLCVPPCPVDCIEMRPAGRQWTAADAAAARRRHDARRQRLAESARRADAVAAVWPAALAELEAAEPAPAAPPGANDERKRAAIAAALARARARRAT